MDKAKVIIGLQVAGTVMAIGLVSYLIKNAKQDSVSTIQQPYQADALQGINSNTSYGVNAPYYGTYNWPKVGGPLADDPNSIVPPGNLPNLLPVFPNPTHPAIGGSDPCCGSCGGGGTCDTSQSLDSGALFGSIGDLVDYYNNSVKGLLGNYTSNLYSSIPPSFAQFIGNTSGNELTTQSVNDFGIMTTGIR